MFTKGGHKIRKIVKVILVLMIAAGIAISYINFTTTDVDAGQITKYGTFDFIYETCGGTATNCVDVWHVPDNPDNP
jgi:hypothetical protein